MKAATYSTEAALCADFIAWVKAGRSPVWTPYAETAGWDILLVAADGTQIGVQAKLRINLKVIAQSIPDRWSHWHDSGPDFRAVLVPGRDDTAEQICAALGLGLFAPDRGGRWPPTSAPEFRPGIGIDQWSEGWHYWSPRRRCELPEFVPDVVAGASAPVRLTKWKIQALRIIAALEIRGHVTRADFKAHRVDPRRWTGPQGWLRPGVNPGEFVRGPGLDFDAQHPEVYAKVLEEARRAPAEE